jgi:DNA-directed RNA polymerase specialized sigma24 family protein
MPQATPDEIELHKLTLSGDETAFSRLFSLYSEEIFVSLKKLYPVISRKDEAIIMESVSDGFFGYYKNPSTFNPEISTLNKFLHLACERDLINIMDKDERKIKKMGFVKVADDFWNRKIVDEENPESILLEKENEQTKNHELKNVFDNEVDIELAKLIRNGERRTEMFSKVLKIENLSFEEQQKIVKKSKDRIKVILKRKQKIKIQ